VPCQWTIGYISAGLQSHARLIDPLTLAHAAVSNLSAPAAVARAFDASWAAAAATRSSAHPHWNITNATWLSIWSNLSGVMPPSLHVRPMHAGSCAEPDLCIGVAEAEKGAAEHPCVCYDKEVEAAAVEREKMVEAGEAREAADAADAAEAERVAQVAEAEVVAQAAGEAEGQTVGVEQSVAKRPHPLLPLHTISGFSSGGDMAMIHLVRAACSVLLTSPHPASPPLPGTGRLLLRYSRRHSGRRRAVRLQPAAKLGSVSLRQANLPVPPEE